MKNLLRFRIAAIFGLGAAALAAEDTEVNRELGESAVIAPGLTGGWGGARSSLAENGLAIELNGVHSFQGVASGGLDTGHDSGNTFSGNLGVVFDTEKAGLWPGGQLRVRLEGRGGEGLAHHTGTSSPVNNQALFPLVEERAGEEVWALTELVFTQFLSERFALTGGLINTTYGDNNPITGNAISNQHFMNMAFLYSPVEADVVPAVTLGGGFIVIPRDGIQATFTVVGSEETAGYNPFERYEGTTFSTEWEFEYKIGGKPGGMVFGGLYSVDQPRRDFGNPRLNLEEFAEEEFFIEADAWAVFWNGFQFLTGDEERGTGVFARLGLADGHPNPIRWHGALGVGGVGPWSSRPRDRWGLGMYYQDLANGTLTSEFGLDSEIGAEFFYNIALTSWMNLTLDAQVIDASVPDAGTVVVLGTRLAIRF